MRWVLGLVLAAFAAPLAAETKPSAPLPIADFAQLPFMQDPELSPDGTKVAARLAVGGKQVFAIIPLGGKPLMIGLGDSDLNWWSWVSDEWLVAGIGDSTKVEGEDWYIRRAIGISATTAKITKLLFREAAQGADDVLWLARDGSPRILLAAQRSIYVNRSEFWPAVFEIDVSTGRAKDVVNGRPGVMSWYADAGGAVRMGVGYDDASRRSRLLYRDGGKGAFRVADTAREGKGESLTLPALFLGEPGKAVAFHEDDGGFNALYELDLPTLAPGRKLFGAQGFDVDGIVSDATGAAVAGVHYTADAAQVHWFDPTLAKVQSELDKAVGANRRARIVSLSRNRQGMIVHVGAPDYPGAYYFFDTAVGTMKLFAHVSQTLKSVRLGPVKTIRYKARDGLEIPAVLTLPAGRDARALPLIVMPHGGPRARDAEEWDWWVQFLADRGYAVIQPNYRGSTGYGAKFRDAGDGEWGLKMQDDLNDAVEHLAKAGIADPKRVCVVGASYGGYAAMRAAQRDGARYRCAVSFAGVSDLAHLARFDSRSIYGNSARAYLKEQAPDFRSVSPINFAAEFTAPILLVHGAKDLRVPVKQSREMAERLRKAGKPHAYVEQPLGDHHFSRETDRVEFLARLEAFLKEHNPA